MVVGNGKGVLLASGVDMDYFRINQNPSGHIVGYINMFITNHWIQTFSFVILVITHLVSIHHTYLKEHPKIM